MSQTERLYWIDAEIRAGRYPNADSVCERFEVSRRTAYADRDELISRLNAPLVNDRSKGGWTYADRTYAMPFLALSEPEARVLARSLLTAREYLGATDAGAVELLAAKLGELPSLPVRYLNCAAGPTGYFPTDNVLYQYLRIRQIGSSHINAPYGTEHSRPYNLLGQKISGLILFTALTNNWPSAIIGL